MNQGGVTIEAVALLVAVGLCVLLVIRAAGGGTRPYRLAGLVWMASRKAYWGPCCEQCLNQYALMPAFNSADGAQYYQLLCPICQVTLEGRAFTLKGLLDLEEEATRFLHRPRVGVSLANCVIGMKQTYPSV